MTCKSSCPVCNVPCTPREARAAPNMDNLVNIYKCMEFTSHDQICSSQNAEPTKTSGEQLPDDGRDNHTDVNSDDACYGSASDQIKYKRRSERVVEPDLEVTNPQKLELLFPNKKRIHVPHSPLKDLETGLDEIEELYGIESDLLKVNRAHEVHEPSHVPFFWLRDEDDNLSQHTDDEIDIMPPNVSSFSDLDDSLNEDQRKSTFKVDNDSLYDEPLTDISSQNVIGLECLNSDQGLGANALAPAVICTEQKTSSKIAEALLDNAISEPKSSTEIDIKHLSVAVEDQNFKRKNSKSSNQLQAVFLRTKRQKLDPPGVKQFNVQSEGPTLSDAGSDLKVPVPMNNLKIHRVKDNSKPLQKLCNTKKSSMGRCNPINCKIVCAFCHSSEETEDSGEMMHYLKGKPVFADCNDQIKLTHVHRNCAEWAPNVYFDDEVAINLENELARSKRIKCSLCSLKGAALGCYEKTCRNSFHFTCAKLVPQCRWDTDNFVMLCPLHAPTVLPNEDSAHGRKKKCSSKRQKRSHGNRFPVKPNVLILCCSGLTATEKEIVSKFQRLFEVPVLKKWDPRVTHIIASIDEYGACKRTLKVLMGILEGKWILNIQWVKDSMKALKLLKEEHYEIALDAHGVRDGPRLGRQRVINKMPKIFQGTKFYFMAGFTPSYRKYIQDLITCGGGNVLQRKPVSESIKVSDQSSSSSSTFIIYSTEMPGRYDNSERDAILQKRQADAETLATVTSNVAVSNSWVLNSIAGCKVPGDSH